MTWLLAAALVIIGCNCGFLAGCLWASLFQGRHKKDLDAPKPWETERPDFPDTSSKP